MSAKFPRGGGGGAGPFLARSLNPFKLLWLFLLPARMIRSHLKMKALECSQHFSHYKSMENFSEVQGQLTP